MTEAPFIDVMLPFYGDADQFRTAVESVRAQTHPRWRLVCVDDAHPSPDAGRWVQGLGDPRVEYIRNPSNLGVARNFNRCLDLVTAPHFVMMGGDDIMRPGYLAHVAAAVQRHPRAALIQPGVAVIDDSGRPAMPLADRIKALLRPSTAQGDRVLRGEEMARSLARADWAYFPSILWRSDLAKEIGFDERWDIALDLGLLLEIAMRDEEMVVTDEVCFEYRRHRTSASQAAATDGLRFAQEKAFFVEHAARLADLGWTRAAAVARRHVISRLNAVTELPRAVRARDLRSFRRLLRHVLR